MFAMITPQYSAHSHTAMLVTFKMMKRECYRVKAAVKVDDHFTQATS